MGGFGPQKACETDPLLSPQVLRSIWLMAPAPACASGLAAASPWAPGSRARSAGCRARWPGVPGVRRAPQNLLRLPSRPWPPRHQRQSGSASCRPCRRCLSARPAAGPARTSAAARSPSRRPCLRRMPPCPRRNLRGRKSCPARRSRPRPRQSRACCHPPPRSRPASGRSRLRVRRAPSCQGPPRRRRLPGARPVLWGWPRSSRTGCSGRCQARG
mmetsp:Transcript_45250/g.117539  ORF Transcript_45250/g.117539 Transcript_45250/m.117539 type:complete len:215 (-) Transcript_45250:499-1143(-)